MFPCVKTRVPCYFNSYTHACHVQPPSTSTRQARRYSRRCSRRAFPAITPSIWTLHVPLRASPWPSCPPSLCFHTGNSRRGCVAMSSGISLCIRTGTSRRGCVAMSSGISLCIHTGTSRRGCVAILTAMSSGIRRPGSVPSLHPVCSQDHQARHWCPLSPCVCVCVCVCVCGTRPE